METLDRIFDLTGRVAVITGGNGGIGLGIAQALAAAGCNVSIWGRNTDKNKSAAATMAGCAGKVDTRVCDVSEPASVKAAMAATLQTFGRVDGCFANAGIGGGGRHAPSSTAPKNNGARCLPPISTASFTCFRRRRAT
jgi:NAD(P)-dependent dehydrogenase (short-subunit alcohol dehydrogenase family)